MATPLPADVLQDPEALRRAIIAKLALDPTKLAGFGGGPAFDEQISNLYRTTTGAYGALDLQEARAKQDYEQALALTQSNQARDTRRLENDLADRGLMFSGAAVGRRAQLGTDYANRIQSLNTAQTRGLEDVGTARNTALNSLLSGKSTYEASYTQQLQDWLQQQAQASAQTALGQQLVAAAKPKTTAYY